MGRSLAAHRLPLAERAEKRILIIRSQRVILDSDIAALYGVSVKRLNEQVKRNPSRFPPDFMFQLTPEEYDSLRSQFATLKKSRGEHRKYLPYAFSEHGVAMLSSVLSSPRAIEVNIAIIRAFIRLREVLTTHAVSARKIAEIRRLMPPMLPAKSSRRIGF